MNALQKRVLVLLSVLVALQTAFNLFQYSHEIAEGARLGGDFLSFWSAAQHLGAGDHAAIYDSEMWQRALAQENRPLLAWFVYPPFALFGMLPMAGLGHDEAIIWWSLLPLPVYFALVALLVRRIIPADPSGASGFTREQALVAFLVCLLSLRFLLANLFSGQTGAWIAVFLLGAAHFWERRPILAGICIGLIAIKPQLGLLLPFAVVAAGQWRTFWAAAATICLLIATSTAWLGLGIWVQYWKMLGVFGSLMASGYDGIKQLELGPYVSLISIGVPAPAAASVQAICSLAAVAGITLSFWHSRGDSQSSGQSREELRFAMLSIGILAATPYSLSYDTPMLALVLIALVGRAWRYGWQLPEFLTVLALIAAPFVTPVTIGWKLPFGFLALLMAAAVTARLYWRGEVRTFEEDGSPGLIRTGGRPINSRMLYR